MRKAKWGLAAALALLALADAARADDAANSPPPDKSRFTVFNPTPAADLRPLCPDRPSKATGPCTVDAGHFQLETDIVNWTHDTSGGFDTTTWLAPNPTLKLGLTNQLDIELNWAPFVEITTEDRATGRSARAAGVGDVFLRAKLNLVGDDGGDTAVAIEPFVKLPTAGKSVGDGAVEEGVLAPVQFT